MGNTAAQAVRADAANVLRRAVREHAGSVLGTMAHVSVAPADGAEMPATHGRAVTAARAADMPASMRPDMPASVRPDTPASVRPDTSASVRPDTPASVRPDTPTMASAAESATSVPPATDMPSPVTAAGVPGPVPTAVMLAQSR